MGKALFLRGLRVPRNGNRISLDQRTVLGFENLDPVRVENRHLAFLEDYGFFRQGQKRSQVTGAIVLSISEAKDERAFLTRAENNSRPISARKHEAVRSVK